MMIMVFSVSKDHTNKDVKYWICVRNVAGELALTDKDKIKA